MWGGVEEDLVDWMIQNSDLGNWLVYFGNGVLLMDNFQYLSAYYPDDHYRVTQGMVDHLLWRYREGFPVERE